MCPRIVKSVEVWKGRGVRHQPCGNIERACGSIENRPPDLTHFVSFGHFQVSTMFAKLKGRTLKRSDSNGDTLPEKIQEEVKEEFKTRQRRRSSVVTPIVNFKGVRRASTVSTSSACMYERHLGYIISLDGDRG